MKHSMSPSFPVFIGSIIAAVSITQENYGGAIFSFVVGGGISLGMHLISRKK